MAKVSREEKTLRICRSLLVNCLDPDNVADALYSEFIITPTQLAKCTHKMWTREENARNLADALEQQVKGSEEMFHKMIEVIDREPAHKALVNKLMSEYYQSSIFNRVSAKSLRINLYTMLVKCILEVPSWNDNSYKPVQLGIQLDIL